MGKNKMMRETSTNRLEDVTERICPLLNSHCRRRVVVGLSEKRCNNGSYKGCDTYQVVVVRKGPSYTGIMR